MEEKYQIVIGLEVHAQLKTASKLFCSDSTQFGAAPNTQVSPVSLAHPGTLPMMNKAVIESAVKLGLCLNCDIEQKNYFARKNYFYPDLPKAYQISQHTTPICKNGFVSIVVDGKEKKIALTRIHIEEDAGKSIHDNDDRFTSIDLNRAGTPLVEIVSEPVMHSSNEAFAFVTELRKLLRWIDVCDGNMEEGSMRCDVNISVRPVGATYFGTRVEIKNLNSIRNIKKAAEVEAARLIRMTEAGETIVQETRSYDADNNTTFSLRSKEDADDYRYFADPDLTPFVITDNFLEETKKNLPELPNELVERYKNEWHLTAYDAATICADKATVDYFEQVIEHNRNAKAAANFLLGPIKAHLNERDIDIEDFNISAKTIAALIALIDEGKINFGNASGKVFQALLENNEANPLDVASELNLLQESDFGAVEQWVAEAIAAMPDKVAEYKKGKKGLIGVFAGEVKRRSKGKADMQVATKLLAEKLEA